MYYHVWFVTKYRKALLDGKIEKFVKDILAECIERHNYRVLELETNKDHLHMLVEAKDKAELAALVRTLKAVSAKEILRTPHFGVGNVKHFWAKQFGSREIGEDEVANIREYIRNQKKIPHALVSEVGKDTPHFRVGNETVVIPHTEVCGHLTSKCHKVYLRTFGCQMNVRDSEIVRGMLEEHGYVFVDEPDKADIVIFNTCSVREHAEHRAVSNLAAIARKKPRRIFGLIGCVAEHRREALFRTIPNLDFICGPSDIYRIQKLLDKSEIRNPKSETNSKFQILNSETRPLDYVNPHYRESNSHAYVNITYGCNNFCSYCIVPYVRGKEVSRPAEDILKEIKELVDRGIRDVTLLGQNVNSYKSTVNSPQSTDFVELLKKVNNINGINKISFITSHPKDADVDLFKAMRDLDKVKKELHLPLQSGSNRILKLMNRGYTIEKYMGLIENYRKLMPDSKLTTDIIVGFPTETDGDFNMTKKAMEEIRFDNAYIFKYSPRPPAKSAEMCDDVNLNEKKRRNNELLDLQRRISRESEGFVVRRAYRVVRNTIVRNTKTMLKKIFVFLLVVMFLMSFNSFAYDRDEKRAFEEIEALFLKEDFQTVKTKCDRFLRDHRDSRLKRRVRELKDIATKKIVNKEESKEIYKKEEEIIGKKALFYIVQIGAFRKYNNAIKLKKRLKKQGFDSAVLKVRRGRQIFYRVRAGKFKFLENAEKLVRDLKKKGYAAEIISEE